jgi:SpoVK/Ycf46/Vps4 family AAA+-type ATPase
MTITRKSKRVLRQTSTEEADHNDDQPCPLIQLWILRLLVPLKGYDLSTMTYHTYDDEIVRAIGMSHWLDNDHDNEYDGKKAWKELRHQYHCFEAQSHRVKTPDRLLNNIKQLGKLIGLSQIDQQILGFVILLHNDHILDEAADQLGAISTVKAHRILSVLLECSEGDIRQSLAPNSLLVKSGLVGINRNGSNLLKRKLLLLSNNFADKMATDSSTPEQLLEDSVTPANAAHLSMDDYPHIQKEIDILTLYLSHVSNTRRPGVNILIHGAPGTGKTQLAKAIANQHDQQLFEVVSENSDGEAINGYKRLSAYRAAQHFFVKKQALMVFDEIEDIFDDEGCDGNGRSTAQSHKALINRMLEENPMPTFWLSNAIHCIDPAFVRRFDMVIELPVPPKAQRQRIIEQASGGLLDDNTIQRIADSDSLAPALITRTAAVINTIKNELASQEINQAFELLVNNTLKTQGHQPIKTSTNKVLPTHYDPAFINANTDLAAIANQLSLTKSARLCLYGPPGTGKTAYAHWLAEQLNLPIREKKASDLISCYVGDTEKNIAAAFALATNESALLIIDEIDSFLQDRRGATNSWEVTAVNEMLTQMEAFEGVFIASTNLMDNLDQAALRRFDLKIQLNALHPDQRWELLKVYCHKFALNPPLDSSRTHLNQLQQLTPGDFAAIARRHRFSPISSPKAMIEALNDEHKLKEGEKRSMGFIHK